MATKTESRNSAMKSSWAVMSLIWNKAPIF